MKVGEIVLVEGEILEICDGFMNIRFPKVGTQRVAYARVSTDKVQPLKARKPTVAD